MLTNLVWSGSVTVQSDNATEPYMGARHPEEPGPVLRVYQGQYSQTHHAGGLGPEGAVGRAATPAASPPGDVLNLLLCTYAHASRETALELSPNPTTKH